MFLQTRREPNYHSLTRTNNVVKHTHTAVFICNGTGIRMQERKGYRRTGAAQSDGQKSIQHRIYNVHRTSAFNHDTAAGL